MLGLESTLRGQDHEVLQGETSTKEMRAETNSFEHGVLLSSEPETPDQSSTQQHSDASTQASLFSCRGMSSVFGSMKTVIFSSKLNFLLPFGALAIIVHKWKTGHTAWVFFLSLLGIIPLAERLGYTTEQLSFYTSQTVGGLLNATFGNATELIIAIFALKRGETRIVQLSLLGSVLSNLFFVLGCAFFCGGLVGHRKEQAFTKAIAVVDSGVLLIAVMSILFPAVLHYTHGEVHPGKSELGLSRFSSCVMLLAYAAYIFNHIKSQRESSAFVGDEEQQLNGDSSNNDEEVPQISLWEGLIWLAIVTAGISVLSDYLVDAMEGASSAWNMSMPFISAILPPIAGNAAALTSAVMFAVKDKLDMSLGVAIGSSTQILMFVVPSCVVVGWIIGCPMDLNFRPFETTSLFITVIIVAYFLQYGTCNYLKGLLLILCYLIVAASFFVHDEHSSGDDKKHD